MDLEKIEAELLALPAEGLTFVVLKSPEPPDQAIKLLGDCVRSANPNAMVVALPADFSFRIITEWQAKEFARNMTAFVSDDALAEIGLYRIEESLVANGWTPEQLDAMKTQWEKVMTDHHKSVMAIARAAATPETILADFAGVLPTISDMQLAAFGLQRAENQTTLVDQIANPGAIA